MAKIRFWLSWVVLFLTVPVVGSFLSLINESSDVAVGVGVLGVVAVFWAFVVSVRTIFLHFNS